MQPDSAATSRAISSACSKLSPALAGSGTRQALLHVLPRFPAPRVTRQLLPPNDVMPLTNRLTG
ncbi:hypothetical protein, partial [Thiolapillus sp.]|uniref:hypothetical protein n=1 Tax=Thiolapillus sp. TaxID=2017437 RepID=UPI003AF4FD58